MMSTLAALLIAVTAGSLSAPRASPAGEITYAIAARGQILTDLDVFADRVAALYSDPRGWSLGGNIHFRQVRSGGDFTLWIASPDAMRSFGGGCGPDWSCRVGRDVVINDERWRTGSPYWHSSLDEYRAMLINHETGHWLGFDHAVCPAFGADAPVMMQQSLGTGECRSNPWPLAAELEAAAKAMGVDLAQPGDTLAGHFRPVP